MKFVLLIGLLFAVALLFAVVARLSSEQRKNERRSRYGDVTPPSYLEHSERRNPLLSERASPSKPNPRRPVAKAPLTDSEVRLFILLMEALPECVILAQVDMKAILNVNKREDKSSFNKVTQKSLDFVICRADFSIVAAVELDDPSHDNDEARYRDAEKDRLMREALIPLVRFDVRDMPTLDTLISRFRYL